MATRRHPLLATCILGAGAVLIVAAALSSPPLSTGLLLAGVGAVFVGLLTLIIWRI